MFESKNVAGVVRQGQGVLTVRFDATVLHACKKMKHHRVGCLVVIDHAGTAVGILTERDLVHKVMSESKDPAEIRVAEAMTGELIYIGPHTSITEAQVLMARKGIRHLPVIDGGLLVGVVSSRDILSHQIGAVKSLLEKHVCMVRELEEDLSHLAV